MNDKKTNFINQQEAAGRLNIHPSTLGRMCERGEGPAFYRIGGQKLFDVDEFEEWREQQKEGGEGSN